MQREQGLATTNSTEPMRMRFQPSSANAALPSTTRLGRKRSISNGRPTRWLRSSSEAWPISSSGKPSAKCTNKPLATALLATSSLLLADGALAADACGTPRNAFDSVYCRSGEFSQADRELNQQFGTLRKHLNDGQKTLLKKSQIAWIKERDAACSESKDNGYFVNLDCATEKTRQRLDFLRERERECLSTGCVDAKL